MLAYACSTQRSIVVKPIESKNKTALLREMKSSEYHYNTFSGKASVSINSKGKKSSIKASLRIKKDSVIWINFSYIGFAGARVLITRDSVKLINFKDSKYLLSDLEYINNLLNIDVDFETIQSLILGNSAPFDEDEKLRTALDKNRYFLSSMRKRRLKKGLPEKRLDKLERKQEKNPERQRYVKKQERKEEKFVDEAYSIWLDVKTRKIVKTLVKDFKNNIELAANYTDFRTSESQLFPYEVNFLLSANDTSEIKVNYTKITKDKPVKFTFNIPEKYERISE